MFWNGHNNMWQLGFMVSDPQWQISYDTTGPADCAAEPPRAARSGIPPSGPGHLSAAASRAPPARQHAVALRRRPRQLQHRSIHDARPAKPAGKVRREAAAPRGGHGRQSAA
jgi:hypothetical protein